MSDCLTDSQIARLVDGAETPAGDAAAQVHLDGCPACRRLLAAVARDPSASGLAATASATELASAESPLARGATVGRYVIMDLVGAGAMGVVYSAYDPELDRKVALKFLRAEGGADPQMRTRLLREAQAMAKLSDPGVLPVHDAGVFQGGVFIAIEFVDGQNLAAWLRAQTRSWREVLAAFVAAGRGLAAAHAAGIIHRDFKPDNVLMGRDGRVRVGDFGLARTGGPGDEDPRGPVATLAPHLTATGALVGTPAYMAPEQLERGPATAATDQYSFCVALYEGLYGRRPFVADSLPALQSAVRAGRVTAAPSNSHVPAWLRRVVLRGMSARPEARFPSMTALLAALGKDPGIVRRRLLVVAGTAAVLAMGALALQRSATRDERLCQGATAEIAEVWEPASKQAVRAALLASGPAESVAAAWATFERLVDAYARGWAAQRTEACEATRLVGTQSEELLDLRMACLHEERESLRAVVDVFSQPRPGLVDGAVKAASALPPLARCHADAALRVRIPPPPEEQRARVAELRASLARAGALHAAGDYLESDRLAQATAEAARALPYLPLEAEALELHARAEVSRRHLKEGAAVYQDAVNAAVAGGHERIAASSLAAMVWTVGVQLGRSDEGQRLLARAAPLAERLGEQRIIGDVLYHGGIIRFQTGDIAGAERSFVRAKTLRVALFGAVHPEVAHIENALGRVANARGDFRAARDHYAQSLSTLEQALGLDHPLLDSPVQNLAETEWEDLADYPRALRGFDRALALRWKRGARSPDAGFAQCERGGLLADLGSVDEGIVELRAGLDILRTELGSDHFRTIHCNRILGRILSTVGQHDEAIALGRSTVAAVAKGEGEGSNEGVQAANELARSLSAAGHGPEAIAVARRAVEVARRDLHPEHPYTARASGALCRVLVDQRQPDALATCQAAATDLARALDLTHPLTADALTGVGEAQLAAGDRHAALSPLLQAYTVLVTRVGDEPLRRRARLALDRATVPR